MGNFPGHALPGSFFIFFGLWWTFHMFYRYYIALNKNTKFTSSVIFNCPCLCGRFKDWPIEAYFKLMCICIGFFLEIYTGFSKDWRFVNIGNGQHATMFFFFGLSSVVDILLHYKWPLPPSMDYVSLFLAITVEFILFKFHLHGRTDLDVLLHTLLLYAIAASIISVILEMKYKNNIMCALSRAYCTLLQGTWFWQIGWILYPPFKSSFRWDEDDHEQMMIATMIFAWHAGVNLLIVLAIGGVVAAAHRRFYTYSQEDSYAMKRLINSSSNGDSMVKINEDSESEVEFENTSMLS
ncbi:transmembrane protein 45B-like [Mya arenaria]|uniref:transmembrane protein 45B-like n=1 Tax=Mya arenaria TaxID=6604 RepID=UPI0022E09CCA|nr:transmembrane protein 45B-like [Mya arenaria]XP_052811513.1 transmembrane protein 45B-like [Mya arenaria]XP_052811514.1 transmembrane protein 45B-like [Mya arenaria]